MTTYPVNMDVQPEVQSFFDDATNTISYIVKDPASNACAIIDSVMDIDYAAGRITYDHADELIHQIQSQGLQLEWIIETHVHADHLSAAPYIQDKLGGKIGIGSKIMVVQDTFGKIFNEGTEFQRDGSQFDRLLEDGDTYTIGTMQAFAMYTPGHTPACMVHVVGNAALSVTHSLCQMAVPHAPISRVATPERFMTVFKKCSGYLMRCASLCVTTMDPMVAISLGKPP